MIELTRKVRQWANDRNLITGSTPQAQTLKLMSEVGELADNVGKKRYTAAQDDIGDCLVCLIILSEMIGHTPQACLQHAYGEIKDRKGRMVNGVFVKEGDHG